MNTCYPCSIGKHIACLYKGRSLLKCDCDTCNQIRKDAEDDYIRAEDDYDLEGYWYNINGND